MSLLFRIGAGSFICLLPLAMYFLYLARINGRRRPTLMSGPWDFAFLLLGLSGFLLVGGPLLVSVLDSTWRGMLFSGNFQQIREAWEVNSIIWSCLAGGYLVVLTALIVLFLRLRQPVTVIYNVPDDALPSLLEIALRNRQLQWKQAFGGIEVGRFAGDPALPMAAARYGAVSRLSVEAFPSMRHVSLRWKHADPAIRSEIEAELSELLRTIDSPENPSSAWLTTASVTLFALVVGWLGFLTWVVVTRPRGF